MTKDDVKHATDLYREIESIDRAIKTLHISGIIRIDAGLNNGDALLLPLQMHGDGAAAARDLGIAELLRVRDLRASGLRRMGCDIPEAPTS